MAQPQNGTIPDAPANSPPANGDDDDDEDLVFRRWMEAYMDRVRRYEEQERKAFRTVARTNAEPTPVGQGRADADAGGGGGEGGGGCCCYGGGVLIGGACSVVGWDGWGSCRVGVLLVVGFLLFIFFFVITIIIGCCMGGVFGFLMELQWALEGFRWHEMEFGV